MPSYCLLCVSYININVPTFFKSVVVDCVLALYPLELVILILFFSGPFPTQLCQRSFYSMIKRDMKTVNEMQN